MGHQQHSSDIRVGQVTIDFTNKPVSAWSGMAAVVGALLERIEFRTWVENALPVTETSPNSYGVYCKIVAHVITVFTGGERFGHMQWWSHGVEIFEKAFAVEKFVKSPTSLTRFWNKFDSQPKSEAWSDRAREFAAQLLVWAGVVEGNLNLDSTVMTRYGKQEGARKGYNPKKRGRLSHHPLLAFAGGGYVVNLWNRSGDVSSAQGCIDFFRADAAGLGPPLPGSPGALRQWLLQRRFHRTP